MKLVTDTYTSNLSKQKAAAIKVLQLLSEENFCNGEVKNVLETAMAMTDSMKFTFSLQPETEAYHLFLTEDNSV